MSITTKTVYVVECDRCRNQSQTLMVHDAEQAQAVVAALGWKFDPTAANGQGHRCSACVYWEEARARVEIQEHERKIARLRASQEDA